MKESDFQADWILKLGERLNCKVPLHQDSTATGRSFLFRIQACDLQSCDEGVPAGRSAGDALLLE